MLRIGSWGWCRLGRCLVVVAMDQLAIGDCGVSCERYRSIQIIKEIVLKVLGLSHGAGCAARLVDRL